MRAAGPSREFPNQTTLESIIWQGSAESEGGDANSSARRGPHRLHEGQSERRVAVLGYAERKRVGGRGVLILCGSPAESMWVRRIEESGAGWRIGTDAIGEVGSGRRQIDDERLSLIDLVAIGGNQRS